MSTAALLHHNLIRLKSKNCWQTRASSLAMIKRHSRAPLLDSWPQCSRNTVVFRFIGLIKSPHSHSWPIIQGPLVACLDLWFHASRSSSTASRLKAVRILANLVKDLKWMGKWWWVPVELLWLVHNHPNSIKKHWITSKYSSMMHGVDHCTQVCLVKSGTEWMSSYWTTSRRLISPPFTISQHKSSNSLPVISPISQ